MKRVLFIAALLLLTGCRSQKSATGSESTMTDGHISAVDSETADREEYKWAWLTAFAESLSIRLSADSVKSPEGTVYNPVVDISADGPVVAGESGRETEESDSAYRSTEGGLSASVDRHSQEHEETVAVAEPFPLWKCAVLILGAVVIVTGIVAAYRELHKRR